MVRINKFTVFLPLKFAQKIHLAYSFVPLGFRPHVAPFLLRRLLGKYRRCTDLTVEQ